MVLYRGRVLHPDPMHLRVECRIPKIRWTEGMSLRMNEFLHTTRVLLDGSTLGQPGVGGGGRGGSEADALGSLSDSRGHCE